MIRTGSLFASSRHSPRELIAFYSLLTAISALAFWLVHSYLDIIAFSLTTVIILKPLYDRILHRVGGRVVLTTALTIGLFFLAVVIPLAIALSIVARQAATIVASVPAGTPLLSSAQIAQMTHFYTNLNLPFTDQIQGLLASAASEAASWLAAFALGIGASIPDLISRVFIFLGIVGALLPNYAAFVVRIKRLSPLDDHVDEIFLRKIKLTVWSMFTGIFVIAVAQGLVTGLMFWLVGVPFSSLLTLIAVVASMFPLGASLVALPVSVFLFITGRYIAGAIVLAGYILVVSNVDTLLRPRLVHKEAHLSFALVLLSALGGYELFGFFGVVYGPVLMILFLTALEVYEEYYAEDAALALAEPTPEVTDDDAGVKG